MDNLLVDLYAGDLRGKPDLNKLAQIGVPWVGVLLKANQGTWYPKGASQRAWFQKYWVQAETVGTYGHTWIRGAYDYADLNTEPEREADFMLELVGSAGGFRPGYDMMPVLDVEQGGNPEQIGRRKLENWIGRYANHMRNALGCGPILYGNIYLAENGVVGLCGCEGIIIARYTATLPPYTYTRLGLALKDLVGWQYTGTGSPTPGPLNYPSTSPLDIHEKVDITALQWPVERLIIPKREGGTHVGAT